MRSLLPAKRLREHCDRVRITLAAMAVGLLAACGGGGGSGPPVPPLTLSSPAASLGAGTTQTLLAAGGQAPYMYSIVSGGGSVSAAGVFTAPETAGTTVVEVTDARGTTAQTSLQSLVVAFSRMSASVDPATTTSQTATGGALPYTYSVVSGGGSIDAAGNFTAPTGPVTVTLQVTDAHGGTAEAMITVNAPLLASQPAATIGGGTTLLVAATGGQGPFTYSVTSGGGSVDTSGHFTAPATPGTSVVTLTDALGVSVSVTLTINPPLAIIPVSATLTAGSAQTTPFVGTNGVPPYSYALLSGGGAIDLNGIYTVGSSSGASAVQVTDSQGTSVVAQVRALRIRVNGAVFATASDGTNLFVGGRFSAVNPYSTPRLAIVDQSSGNLASTCDLGSGFLDGYVSTVATLGNSIYVAGGFNHYRGVIVGKLAKIDATSCALDTTFTRSGGFGQVSGAGLDALVVSGTSLYVAGNVSTYRGVATVGVLKLDATSGDPDPTFAPASGADAGITSLQISGSTLYVGGYFSTFNGIASPYLAKLDAATGAVDTAFAAAPGADAPVMTLAIGPNGLYVGGIFKHYAGALAGVVKIDPTSGVLDTTFSQNVANYTGAASLLVSGTSLYVGLTGSTPTLAKIDATTGVTDPTFAAGSGFNSGVTALLVTGNSLYVGGSFSTYRGFPAFGLAKLDSASGVLDTTFTHSTGANSSVSSLALVGTQLIAGGDLSTYRGAPAHNLAKFALASNAVDAAFTAAAATNSNVVAMALHSNVLYIGGGFTTCGSTQSYGIAKVDAGSGAPDAVFAAGGGSPFGVSALLIHGNSLYLGGDAPPYLAKMDLLTGQTDAAFGVNGTPGGMVYALADSATAIYAGGQFQNYGAVPIQNLAKLDPTTGALDQNFTQSTGAGASLEYVLSLLANGTAVYAGGNLTTYRGQGVQGLIKVDGVSGALDTTFTQSSGILGVAETLLSSNSSLYVAGYFSNYRGSPSPNLAKLDLSSGNLDTSFAGTSPCDSCGVNMDSLLVVGSSLYVGADAPTLFRGAPSYGVFPIDALSGAPSDP